MSFKDIRFPPLISFHAIGGPGFLTNVVIMNSGHSSRNQVWDLEKGEWEVSHAARLPEQYRPLQKFFRVVRGQAYTFRFKDWSDFEVDEDQGVFLMLSATTFLMYKRYDFDGELYDRVITKPVDGTVDVTGGTVSSINYATGIVTMSSGTPTAWSGEFDCHCRFGTDKMQMETIDRNKHKGLIIGWSSIPIIEERE